MNQRECDNLVYALHRFNLWLVYFIVALVVYGVVSGAALT